MPRPCGLQVSKATGIGRMRQGMTWTRLHAGLAALLTMAVVVATSTSADARRVRSIGKSAGAPATSPAATRARQAQASSGFGAFNLAALGLQVHRVSREKLQFLYELPPMNLNTLKDGRHFHLGEVSRFLIGGKKVGWVGRGEYVELETRHLAAILDQIGYPSVAAFDAHLAKVGPMPEPGAPQDQMRDDGASAPGADVDAATAASLTTGGFSPAQLMALAAGGVGLLGFLSYCLVVWHRGRVVVASPAASVSVHRVTKMSAPAAARTPAAVPARGRAGLQPASSRVVGVGAVVSPASTQRRAPRDLSALVRKPTPA